MSIHSSTRAQAQQKFLATIPASGIIAKYTASMRHKFRDAIPDMDLKVNCDIRYLISLTIYKE